MSYLVFVDTNILLDFYRVDSGDATISLLRYFDGNYSKIITTSEVEMEFKKNRQRVILSSITSIKINKSELISIPAFLRESKLNKSVEITQKKLNVQSASLVDRATKILKYPSRYDPIYKALQRLFKSRGACHLTREKKIRYDIRDLAKKRFMLGYPPRKGSDLSVVDAINWEWIIHCAKNCSDDIVIVSRDTDYGEHYKSDSILNDWLLQEFKERISHRRSIILTRSLSEALKLAAISVSEEEEKSEEKLLEARYRISDLGDLDLDRLIVLRNDILHRLTSIDTKTIPMVIQKILKEQGLLITANEKESAGSNPLNQDT